MGVIAILVPRAIIRPVQVPLEVLGCLACGDLTVSLDRKFLARQDEMGQMLGDLEKTSQSLVATVRQVTHSADTVFSSTNEIS
ncbi:hypothetical protein DFAR_3630006 [Desulfarculales bacterium]